MKRVLALIFTVAFLLSGCFFMAEHKSPQIPREGLSADDSVYPIYDNLNHTEKGIWANIRKAAEEHSSEEIFVGEYASQAELERAKTRLNHFMRELSYTYPDFFWLDAHSFQMFTTQRDELYTLSIVLQYIVDEVQAQDMSIAYENAVADIVYEAEKKEDLFDRVLYVYDTILETAKYDYELAESDETGDLGRTAYGCLVEGETVCSGYAMAFRTIMDRLGIECGVEFNSYSDIKLSSDGHVWNYCKLDSEYYYFDLTWDDTGFDSEEYRDVIPYSHLYFGITADELNSSTYDIDPNAPTPACNGTKYNYFIHEGLSFSEYDYDTVAEVLRAHQYDPQITLRFDSYFELEQAVTHLIEEQMVFQALPSLTTLSYLASETDHHLVLIF